MSFTLQENTNLKDVEKFLDEGMDKEIKLFEKEILTIRTGRAHPSMVEDIKVNAYGSIMRLKEVGAISTPDAKLIIIQPWDKTIMADIEKAILISDLGFTPINDGNVIRIQLPEISSERREELVKILHQKLEKNKVGIRSIRKDFHNLIRENEKAKKISEDFAKRITDLLQKITDKNITKIDEINSKKEKEIRSV